MTAPRLARASRSRFFIGFVALLLIVGFVAIFHSSQQQLDESRELTIRCEQREEALNARMQAIVEHKVRLEKSLDKERKEHLETKQNLEQKAKEERDINAKATMESGVRFDSLQQHYKLLQSEHNDLVDDCGKAKELQLEQNNGQERKLKSLQSQLVQSKSQRDKDVAHWKLKYDTLENEKRRMEILYKKLDQKETIAVLTRQINDFENNCRYRPQHSTESNLLPNALPLKSADLKDFKEQIAVSEDLYKISIVRNNPKLHATNNKTLGNGLQYGGTNVGRVRAGSVINSVENFQIIPKPLAVGGGDPNSQANDDNKEVLQQPPPLKNSSTSPTDLKTSENFQKYASLTSEKTKRSSTLANNLHRNRLKQLPQGVAPVPDNFDVLLKNDEKNDSDNNNNRYANVVDELSGKKDDTEQENGAHEIKDNDFNLADDKNEAKDHLQEVLNNAAEDDTNNLVDAKPIGQAVGGNGVNLANHQLSIDEKKGQDDDDIHVVGNNKHAKVGRGNAILQHDGDDKLINEVVGDQGKEAAFADGLHMEEPNEEDEEDEDEYSDTAARQQEGLAVRN